MESLNGVGFSRCGRVPSAHQWKMLEKLDDASISLEEFLEHWRLNKTQLAQILGCDRGTVRRWLAHTSEPSCEQKWRLAMVHRLWSRT
jgi:hypothetical protein